MDASLDRAGPRDIVIRPVEPCDREPVRELMRQLSGFAMSAAQMQERLDFVAQSPVDWLYVATIDGQVRGAIGFRLRERIERPGRVAEVSALVTDASVRRSGVGRALLGFAEQLACAHGCDGMFLVSGFKRQDEAHRFYTQLGYEITGYRFVKDLD
jgi:GNAT superfamily N-acetyltransferase